MALKKFVFVLPLVAGLKLFVPFMVIINIVSIVLIILQVLDFTECTTFCSDFTLCSTYALSATGLVFCVCMILVHGWFYVMGIQQKKASVVMAWLVITTIWVMEAFILIITLVSIYINYTSLTIFIISIVLTLVAFCIAIYGLLIGYGYWKELKALKAQGEQAN